MPVGGKRDRRRKTYTLLKNPLFRRFPFRVLVQTDGDQWQKAPSAGSLNQTAVKTSAVRMVNGLNCQWMDPFISKEYIDISIVTLDAVKIEHRVLT